MFLLLARTNLDEIPLQLCTTRTEAVMAAMNTTEEKIRQVGRNVMGVDDAGIVCLAVVEFMGGIARRMDIVRDWEDGQADEAKPTKKAKKAKRSKV